MTRLEIFLKLFPRAELNRDGYPNLLPCDFGACVNRTEFGCDYVCGSEYWEEEIEI